MASPTTYQVGWVYVLGHVDWNDSRVKIGMTTRTVEHRIEELNKSSMLPPDAYLAFAVLVRNPAEIEAQVHAALQSDRVDKNRELFNLNEGEASAFLYDYLMREGVEIIERTGTKNALAAIEPEAIAERQKQMELEQRIQAEEQDRKDLERLRRFKNLDMERRSIRMRIEKFDKKYAFNSDKVPAELCKDLADKGRWEDGSTWQQQLERWEGFPVDVDEKERIKYETKLMRNNDLIDSFYADIEKLTEEVEDFNWVSGRKEIYPPTKSLHPRWFGNGRKGKIPKRYRCVLADTEQKVPRAE